MTDLDWRVRHFVFEFLRERGRAPTPGETAAALGLSEDEARAAYDRLNEKHLLVLGSDGVILMAHPFSNVPTPFEVVSNGVRSFANCAWDTLGIPAALHQDATMRAPFADGGDVLEMAVRDGRLEAGPALVHFPLPLRHWYDDIVFT
jgi:hypothetical protein